MAKKNLFKETDECAHTMGIHGMDFYDEEESPTSDAIAGMMSGMVEASIHQQKIALGLTKLIVENNPLGKMNEEKIFALFERAIFVVTESSPLSEIFENHSK